MCNETKVNTNNPDSSPSGEKNVEVKATEYVGSFAVPYGRTFIERRGADDHLAMRAAQLTGLLALMIGEHATPELARFSDKTQHSLLWLAQQMSNEIQECLPFVQEPEPRRQYESTPLP